MKLAISNIAWNNSYNEEMYEYLKNVGFSGLEIAPTKIFGQTPYERISDAVAYSKELMDGYGLCVPSIQSIWFGKNETIIGSEEEYNELLSYTRKAIDFAAAINCNNLVFGCPRNRNISNPKDINIVIDFLRSVGEYAIKKGTVFALEANPPIYNTNFMNTTKEAIDIISKIDCEGIKLNLDLGTMIYNREDIELLSDSVSLINHVHISEPYLAVIEKRELHEHLARLLDKYLYRGYISIEMKEQNSIDVIKRAIKYISEVFG
ncbi:MAG TPA: sugar phosphate isomerase/epimerase [Gallicola sp.]|nr:sugar phosphate isomerase/epimerase [Gallicola sp.]